MTEKLNTKDRRMLESARDRGLVGSRATNRLIQQGYVSRDPQKFGRAGLSGVALTGKGREALAAG